MKVFITGATGFFGKKPIRALAGTRNMLEALADKAGRFVFASSISCQTYFFRDRWEVTWKAYLTDLSAMVGKKPGFSLPYRLAWALGYLAETISLPLGLRPSITRHAVGLMGRDNDVDSTKARTELGWDTRITPASRPRRRSVPGWSKTCCRPG